MTPLRVALACSGLLLTISQGALASVGVDIRVEILAPPPCVINGGSTLNVPFGDELMTTRIDGVSYRRDVPYTLRCDRPTSNAMTITLQGTGAAFDGGALSTSNSDLGVKVFVDGTVWPLNNTLDFTYPNAPRMEVVLVKKADSTLKGGAFSAAATIVVGLQ